MFSQANIFEKYISHYYLTQNPAIIINESLKITQNLSRVAINMCVLPPQTSPFRSSHCRSSHSQFLPCTRLSPGGWQVHWPHKHCPKTHKHTLRQTHDNETSFKLVVIVTFIWIKILYECINLCPWIWLIKVKWKGHGATECSVIIERFRLLRWHCGCLTLTAVTAPAPCRRTEQQSNALSDKLSACQADKSCLLPLPR